MAALEVFAPLYTLSEEAEFRIAHFGKSLFVALSQTLLFHDQPLEQYRRIKTKQEVSTPMFSTGSDWPQFEASTPQVFPIVCQLAHNKITYIEGRRSRKKKQSIGNFKSCCLSRINQSHEANKAEEAVYGQFYLASFSSFFDFEREFECCCLAGLSVLWLACLQSINLICALDWLKTGPIERQ